MTGPVIQGWCPGALRPMQSGDGLVVRIRPHGGRLTQVQARGIAEVSARLGNGLIDLTARANLQLRGVTRDGHGPLIEALRALDLIDASVAAETRRNVVVEPFWHDGDATQRIARALETLLGAQDAPATPAKFGYAVDCGPKPILRDVSADIRIERQGDNLIVRPDGAMTAARATPETAPDLAIRLAAWFLASGGAPGGRGRMAALIARGAVLPPPFGEVTVAPPGTPLHVGPGPVAAGMLVALEFGQVSAKTMSVLAGSGSIRITPWRMLLIEGGRQQPDIPGLVHAPHSPLLRTAACTGAPGCPQALIATRGLARHIAAKLGLGQTLHVSGCSKGCAHPGSASLTLVGENGGTVAVVRNGAAGDPPLLSGLRPERLTIHDLTEVPDAPSL